ncbi:MAG: GNAT family N-acetyltransferase [Dehalococcoidia bacterium]
MSAKSPLAMSSWMLAWWRHASPPGARLAALVVIDGQHTIGVAPMYVVRRRTGLRQLGLLGTGHRVDPIALPGRERDVAAAAATTLACSAEAPDALQLDRSDGVSVWPSLFARTWPGSMSVVRSATTDAPTIGLKGSTYGEWIASRSAGFRSEHRRVRRRLADRGAWFELADYGPAFESAVDAFIGFSRERWTPRMGARRGPEGVRRMLLDAGAALIPSGHMRVWTLRTDQTIVSVQIFLVAGGEVAHWNGAFAASWSGLRPGVETIVRAVEHAFACGDRRMDMGGGPSRYKLRMADGADPIRSTMLVVGGRHRLRRRLQLLPDDLVYLARLHGRRAPSWLRSLRGRAGRLASSA